MIRPAATPYAAALLGGLIPLRKGQELYGGADVFPLSLKLGWARGISVHPGYWSSGVDPSGTASFFQSVVDVEDSVLRDHAEIALFAEGASPLRFRFRGWPFGP